jgi:hypothetical protein
MPTQKERDEKLLALMKEWQKVEDDAISSTSEILKKTENPIVRLVMEVIRQDSANHRKTQQLIIDHFEKESLKLNPDELLEFWDMVEKHAEIEKKTIALAKESLMETNAPMIGYLLNYLLTDETKHNELLEEMSRIKSGMYPYGG